MEARRHRIRKRECARRTPKGAPLRRALIRMLARPITITRRMLETRTRLAMVVRLWTGPRRMQDPEPCQTQRAGLSPTLLATMAVLRCMVASMICARASRPVCGLPSARRKAARAWRVCATAADDPWTKLQRSDSEERCGNIIKGVATLTPIRVAEVETTAAGTEDRPTRRGSDRPKPTSDGGPGRHHPVARAAATIPSMGP